MFTLNDIMLGNAENLQFHSASTPDPALTFREAQHDNRMVQPGDLFVAIKGARVDGHRFIPAAAQAGALAALCSEPVAGLPAEFLQIVVPDVVKALHATARVRAQRQRVSTTFIGITGSNGKTSTKEAVAAVLSRKAPTLKTLKSYNNEIGYPLTLLRLEPEHRYAVLEMGAQWVGELRWLSESIASPDWSIITNVGTAHLEHFGSQEGIATAKSELVQALDPSGVAILNYDDIRVRAMREKTQARVLYYGTGDGAEVRASSIQNTALSGQTFTLHYHDQQQQVQLHLPGEHGVTIALAAAATGLAADMSMAEVVAALETLAPAPGRGEIKAGPNGSTLIDDSYNANRQSILAIAQAMHTLAIKQGTQAGKRWAVVGDIFELGSYAKAEHSNTGAALADYVDYLVAIGEQARFYVEGAIAAGMPEQNAYYYAADVNNAAELAAAKRAAADLLNTMVQPQDIVLLKGSRGMQMELMLELFQSNS